MTTTISHFPISVYIRALWSRAGRRSEVQGGPACWELAGLHWRFMTWMLETQRSLKVTTKKAEVIFSCCERGWERSRVKHTGQEGATSELVGVRYMHGKPRVCTRGASSSVCAQHAATVIAAEQPQWWQQPFTMVSNKAGSCTVFCYVFFSVRPL